MSDNINLTADDNESLARLDAENANEMASENDIDVIIEAFNLEVALFQNELEVAFPGSFGSDVIITLNGTQTTTPAFYAPLTGGQTNQVLYSRGNGQAPVWGNLPTVPTVTYSSTLTTGTEIGVLTINSVAYRLFFTPGEGATYHAGTGLTLTGTTFSINRDTVDGWYAAANHTHSGYVDKPTGSISGDYVYTIPVDPSTPPYWNRVVFSNYLTANSSLNAAKVTGTLPSSTYTNTNYYHSPEYSEGLLIGVGTGVSDLYVPYGSTTDRGVLQLGSASYQAAPGNHDHAGTYSTVGHTHSAYVYTAGTGLTKSSNNEFYLTFGTDSTHAAAGNHTHAGYLTKSEFIPRSNGSFYMQNSEGSWVWTSFDLSSYATKTWVTGTALSGYAKESWVNNQGFLKSIPTATTATYGGVKVFDDNVTVTATQGTTSNRYYAVYLDDDGRLITNVPWTDTNTTYTAGTGMSVTGNAFYINRTVVDGWYAAKDNVYTKNETDVLFGNKLDKISRTDLTLDANGTGDSPRIYFTKGSAWDSNPDWYLYQSGGGLVIGCRKDGDSLQNIIVNSAGNMTFRGTSPQLDFCITPSNYRNYITRQSDRLRVSRDAGGWMQLLDIMDNGNFLPATGANLGSSLYKFGTLYANYLSNGSQSISVSAIISHICLLEGTMITVSDGTKKPIEDVKAGDVVMSYDPNTNALCEAVVFDNQETGANTDNLKEALFLDEETNETYSLLIYRDHGVYKAYSDDDPLSEGHGTGICSWRCNSLSKDKALASNLHQVTFIGTSEIDQEKSVRHFNLLTSNIYYFADDVLCAGSQWDQVNEVLVRYKDILEGTELKTEFEALDESIQALRPVFKSQKEENSERDGLRLTAESRQKHIRRQLLLRELEDYKQKLSGLAYKNEKYQEGALTEEDWIKLKSTKAEYRRKIGELEYELTVGDINKHGTPEHVKMIKACKDEVALLLNSRSLFDQLIALKLQKEAEELQNKEG